MATQIILDLSTVGDKIVAAINQSMEKMVEDKVAAALEAAQEKEDHAQPVVDMAGLHAQILGRLSSRLLECHSY